MDAWVNVNMGSFKPFGWQRSVAARMRPEDDIFRNVSMQEMLDIMDKNDVEHAVVLLQIRTTSPGLTLDPCVKHVLPFVEARPDRFSIAAFPEPRLGMAAIRELTAIAKNHPVSAVRIMPSVFGIPPDDRTYYPLYAKCSELDIAVSVNVGFGPPGLPVKCQDPLLLDEVCLFFPDLKVILSNGGGPWWDVIGPMLRRHKNLYWLNGACTPRRVPASFAAFMNNDGQDKVIFGSDFPFNRIDACLDEVNGLKLDAGVREKFLYGNAKRVLLSAREKGEAKG
jgi:predicted TIM-barrel fold metal-dependent hydrolase